MAARNEPMTNVTEMTELIFTPISWLVSKSLETARMAMPTLVWLMSSTSRMTSTTTSTGVTSVTIFVVAPKTFTDWEIQGMVG